MLLVYILHTSFCCSPGTIWSHNFKLSWLTLETEKDEDIHILLAYLFSSKKFVTEALFWVLFSEETVVPSLLVSVWLSESGSLRTEISWVVSRFLISMLSMYF